MLEFPRNFWGSMAKNSIGFYRNVVFTQNLQMRSVLIWNDLEIHESLRSEKVFFKKSTPRPPELQKIIYILLKVTAAIDRPCRLMI